MLWLLRARFLESNLLRICNLYNFSLRLHLTGGIVGVRLLKLCLVQLDFKLLGCLLISTLMWLHPLLAIKLWLGGLAFQTVNFFSVQIL
jgi:hypothetical protein